MKSFKMFVLIALTVFFSACEKEGLVTMDHQNSEWNMTASRAKANPKINAQTIVLSAPSIYNEYYADDFENIVDFMVDYANTVEGRDYVIILVDQATRKYFEGRVPDYVLMDANIEDIWIRDFGTTIAGRQVKFNYLPDNQAANTSNWIDNSFENWFKNNGLSYGKKTSLILDGGNVVDNGANRVVVTDRFLWDNPQLTKQKAKNKLKNLLGVTEVAIIPEIPGDATGHADGMLMWADENTILMHELPEPQHDQILKEYKKAFPNVKIVILPDFYEENDWNGFGTACNVFVNSLVTDNYIYMPTFDTVHDEEMLATIQSYTDKEVVAVAAEKVCHMGGSVRCLSWQLKGANADILLNE